jgi:hypothetical protein
MLVSQVGLLDVWNVDARENGLLNRVRAAFRFKLASAGQDAGA